MKPAAEVWLRAPIFDHGVLGLPTRRVSVRGGNSSTAAAAAAVAVATASSPGTNAEKLELRRPSSSVSESSLRGDRDVAFRSVEAAVLSALTPGSLVLERARWLEAARRHLLWSEAEATMVMDLFERMMVVEDAQRIADVREAPARARALRFALFLIVQCYERPRRTSSLDSFNTSAPREDPSATASGAGGGSGGGAGSDSSAVNAAASEPDMRQLVLHARRTEWAQRLRFVQRVLPLMLRVLARLCASSAASSSNGASNGAGAGADALPAYAVDALGFLLAGSEGGKRAGRLSLVLDAAALRPPSSSPTNASTPSSTTDPHPLFSVDRLAATLRDKTKIDEARSPQWWAVSEGATTPSATAAAVAAAAAAATNATGPMGAGARPVVVRGLGQHEVVSVSPTPKSSPTSTFVATCRGATVSSLAPATYAHVIGCSDSTVYLGPVTGVLTIEHCERVHVVAACGLLRLVNCIDAKINVWTDQRPIVSGDCRGIVLGPHSARFPNARRLVETVCPKAHVTDCAFAEQKWRRPVLLEFDGVVDESDPENESVFRDTALVAVQSPDDFFLEPVGPITNATEAAPLPMDYASKLQDKRKAVNDLMRRVHSVAVARAGGSEASSDRVAEAAAEVNETISSAFKDWLVASGNIDALVNLQRFEQVQAATVAAHPAPATSSSSSPA